MSVCVQICAYGDPETKVQELTTRLGKVSAAVVVPLT